MTNDTINEWVECYSTTGKLPSKMVPCSKCATEVTMWSTNLDNRVRRFNGIRNLLETFACRSCANGALVAQVKKKAAPKKVKEAPKKTKRAEKAERVEELKSAGQSFKMDFKGPQSIDLIENPEYCRKHTREGGCWRPDIFLNNDRSCDRCRLYENCEASCRRLSTDKKKKTTTTNND